MFICRWEQFPYFALSVRVALLILLTIVYFEEIIDLSGLVLWLFFLVEYIDVLGRRKLYRGVVKCPSISLIEPSSWQLVEVKYWEPLIKIWPNFSQ
jgi:hypothetical protein